MEKADIQIEVSLDPDVMELLRDLVARVEALEAAIAGEEPGSPNLPHYDLGYLGPGQGLDEDLDR